MSDTILAWHFTGKTLRDGRPIPPVGEWLVHYGDVKICVSGLHASRRPCDALKYAPGELLHLVECRAVVAEDVDKLVCRERRIMASMDASTMLRYYARMQALSVIHLWEPPGFVLDYLMTGNDKLRAAAWAAASDAAWASAWAAAWAAASDAAWASASDAAWAAASDAASDAAWAAASDAVSDAASDEFDALTYECFEGPLGDVR